MPLLPDLSRQLNATPAERRFAEHRCELYPTVQFVTAAIEDERTTPEFFGQFNDLSSIFYAPGYDQTVRQIVDLHAGNASDEYGALRPTEYAYRRTMEVLSRALMASTFEPLRMGKHLAFPRGSVTTDENGGIRIEWTKVDRAVRLVIPAQEGGRSYIYHERGDDYGTNKRVKGSFLASWLHKLLVK